MLPRYFLEVRRAALVLIFFKIHFDLKSAHLFLNHNNFKVPPHGCSWYDKQPIFTIVQKKIYSSCWPFPLLKHLTLPQDFPYLTLGQPVIKIMRNSTGSGLAIGHYIYCRGILQSQGSLGNMATAGLVTMKDFRVLTDGSRDLSAKRLTASGRQLMKYMFSSPLNFFREFRWICSECVCCVLTGI